jgi:uncharacterized protein
MKDQNQEILIRHRMKQAKDALEEANLLMSQSRTTLGAVNRAYYAMFYAVLALLQFINKTPRKHSGAITLFDAEFVKKEIFPKELSINLHKAFESRQVSDYHVVEPMSREDAKEIILNASSFIRIVEDYLMESAFVQGHK